MATNKVLTINQINNTCNPLTNRSTTMGNERVIYKRMRCNRNSMVWIRVERNLNPLQQTIMSWHSRKAITKINNSYRSHPMSTIKFTHRNLSNMRTIKTSPKATKRSNTGQWIIWMTVRNARMRLVT